MHAHQQAADQLVDRVHRRDDRQILRVGAAGVRIVGDDQVAGAQIELVVVENRLCRRRQRWHVHGNLGDHHLARGSGEGNGVVARLADGVGRAVVLQGDAHVVDDGAQVVAQDLAGHRAGRRHCATWIT